MEVLHRRKVIRRKRAGKFNAAGRHRRRETKFDRTKFLPVWERPFCCLLELIRFSLLLSSDGSRELDWVQSILVSMSKVAALTEEIRHTLMEHLKASGEYCRAQHK